MTRPDVYYIYICADKEVASHNGESIEIRLRASLEVCKNNG